MKAIIFDLDGTLYDLAGMARSLICASPTNMFLLKRERAVCRALRNAEFPTREAFAAAYYKEMAQAAFFTAKSDAAKVWYENQYMPLMCAVLAQKKRARSGLDSLLLRLKNAGIALAVFSDYPAVKERLCAIGLSGELSLFDGLYSAWDFGALKPSPRGFLSIASQLGLLPEDCLVVGDRDDTDGEGARRAGMSFVLIQGKKTKKRIAPQRVFTWEAFEQWVEDTILGEHTSGVQENTDFKKNQYGRRHRVAPGVFIPNTGISYPKNPSDPLLTPQKVRDVTVDSQYPFIDKRFKARALHFLIYLGIFALVFPVHRIRYGLRIYGKRNLYKHRAQFKNGAMTVSNHVYRWDFLAVVQAVKKTLWFPAKKENLCTKDAILIRSVGGIPIPTDFSALKHFYAAFDALHKKKKWLHVFPEGSSWTFYQPIRPFKKGGFSLAVKYDLPVIPIGISYRPVTGLRKILGVKHPLISVHIGEPLFKNEALGSKSQMAVDLLTRAHTSICTLCGIEENYWPCTVQAT